METVLSMYLSTMEGDGKAPATLIEYKRELTKLMNSYPEHKLDQFTTFDLEVFLTERCRGLSPASRRKILAILSGFFEYLLDREVVRKNPCRPIKRPKQAEPEPTFWTGEEVRSILRSTMSARDHLLLETLARTGQRSTVVRTLTWAQVRLDDKVPVIQFKRGKGGKAHTMPMDKELLHDMIVYKRLTNPASGDWVFRSKKGNALSHQQVNRIIESACRQAQVRVSSAHEFRRSCITNMLLAGIPLDVVSKDIANHSSPVTTMVHYRGRSEKRVLEALAGLPY